MRNIHERVIDAPADVVGAMLKDLGQKGDRLWPSPDWVPMKLDQPLSVGADGGHGPIRYHVTEYQAGHRVRFEFHERTGVTGYHEFTIEPVGANRSLARHDLSVEPHGLMRILGPAVIEGMHDAVLEDLLDNLERAATGIVKSPATWSTWVRVCRYVVERSPLRGVPIPLGAKLIHGLYARPELQDAWQVTRRPGMSADPQAWADAVFRDPPTWVGALFVVRNALVRFIGVAPEYDGEKAFRTVRRSGNEVLLGSDADHLDFRASILVEDESVTVSTVAMAHNARGRLYLGVVALAHPVIVRGMLRRAAGHMASSGGRVRRAATTPPDNVELLKI